MIHHTSGKINKFKRSRPQNQAINSDLLLLCSSTLLILFINN